ncbi:peptide-methionine (S)-S-oxide reductase [Psychroserpens sp. Hel_I_66]|uniref:peptide-methionine (S)-S-oxide reductase n=1 Tax=Psychroserpens sp. Hel_I_66 TaxID=1250004 RepID=UPI000645CEE0|nr:peptide-methionine (S)-S-oxide reductase [Psychroserpens sp. Hel_I_66]
MGDNEKIGLGGGCHWCTEAVFQSLKGVTSVAQGYISSTQENSSFSEAIIVNYNPITVNLKLLIEVHLLTHKSTKNHSMRDKYRSAIYTFSNEQKIKAETILNALKQQYKSKLVTRVLNFSEFKASREEITNYYYKNPKKPFCETFIDPKLKLLLKEYSTHVNTEKLNHLILD